MRGAQGECFLVEVLVQVLDATNGKDKKVVSADADTARSVVGMASPFAFDLMMPAFLSGLSVKAKPPQKEATLNIIKDFAARNLKATGYALVTLVSPDAGLTCDIKKEGKAAAVECMSAICNCSGTRTWIPSCPSWWRPPSPTSRRMAAWKARRMHLRSERRDVSACCHPASALPRAE